MRALSYRCLPAVCLSIVIPVFSKAAEKKVEYLASSAANSPAGLRVPVKGLLVDLRTGQVRPVVGAAGAAVLGETLTAPAETGRIWISPSGAYAIAERNDDQPISVFAGLGTASPSLRVLDGGMLQADSIEFSRSGSTAAIYSKELRRVQVIRGLPDLPSVRNLDLGSLSGDVTALTPSEDGSTLLVAVSGPASGGGVFRIGADNGIAPVLADVNAASLQFVSASSALVADAGGNRILSISFDAGREPQSKVLAGADAGVDHPVGVAVLSDGRTVVALNSNSKTALCIDIQSGETKPVSLPAPATALRAVQVPNGIAILTDQPAGYWLLSVAGSGEPVLSLISDIAVTASKQ